jgi:hypothetical protein
MSAFLQLPVRFRRMNMNVLGVRQGVRLSRSGRGWYAVREGRGIEELVGGGGPGVFMGLRLAAGPDRLHIVVERGMRLLSILILARPGAVPVTGINSPLEIPG